jgi:hypothetical protein
MARRSYLPLTKVAVLPVEELKREWGSGYGTAAPNISPDLLRLGLAYKVQEQRAGGLSRLTLAALRYASQLPAAEQGRAPPPRKLTPGTRLVRDWHGVGHTVVVTGRGFEYDGKPWKSLSAIARQITGTTGTDRASSASSNATSEGAALCGLYPQVDRGWARAGAQQPACST